MTTPRAVLKLSRASEEPVAFPVLDLFEAALRGEPGRLWGLHDVPVDLHMQRWVQPADESDRVLLGRCDGPTLDIGCGPGRMTEALLAGGVIALGIDVVPEAIASTHGRGGVALNRDVFAALPGEGRWACALLADGNIGIGGDPVRLLRRVRELVARKGRIIVDLARPGGGLRTRMVWLEVGVRRSVCFPWAIVPADSIHRVAEQAGLRVTELVEHRGRWIAELSNSGPT